MNDFSVLAVMAMPPPMTGQAAAAAMLGNAFLRHRVKHAVVNFSRELAPPSKLLHLAGRAFSCGLLPARVLWAARRTERVGVFYLQLGQGPRSLARDLPLLEMANLRRWPMVLHVHGGGLPQALAESPRLLRERVIAAVRRARAIVALSPVLAAAIEEATGARNIRVVANGVDRAVEEAASRPKPRPQGRESLRVLFLSNLIDSKGYPLVLECAKEARRRKMKLEFVLAGAPTDMMSMDPADYIARNALSNTTFVGPADERQKLALLRDADVFILPSTLAEGQPISILEALHFGLPILCAPVGGIPDIVEDGRTGFFVSPVDPDETLARLSMLLEDPAKRRAMSDACRMRATSFTELRHGDRMIELLRSAATTDRSEMRAGGPPSAGGVSR